MPNADEARGQGDFHQRNQETAGQGCARQTFISKSIGHHLEAAPGRR
jgi:hypothetical protein